MAIDEGLETTRNDSVQFTGLSNLNPDAPEFAKEIAGKSKKAPITLNTDYTPDNPYSLTIPGDSETFQEISGNKPEQSSLKMMGVQAYRMNNIAQFSHYKFDHAYEEIVRMGDTQIPGWTPNSDPEKLYGVKPKNLDYVMNSTGPNDLDYRIQSVMAEQANDELLEDGSLVKRAIAGLAGALTDPLSYIPIVNGIKYAKYAPSMMSAAAKAFPGIAGYSFLSSGVHQLDSTTGKLQDFFLDGFINTTFGTALFGAAGAGSLLLEKMNLWNLKGLTKSYIEGIDFKLATNEAKEVTGLKAIDTTGTLSADKVSFAQELADSSFSKSGLFKVPYLGDATIKLMGNRLFGTPLIRLMNSSFDSVTGFVDRAVENSYITKRILQGKGAPDRFETKMRQEYAGLRALNGQFKALRLERNGYDIKNRALAGIVDTAMTIKNESAEAFTKTVSKVDWASPEQFYTEVERVLFSKEQSQHGAVNEAAGIARKHIDGIYSAYREAHNLPADWLPPRTAEGFLMRVYDTPYMNTNLGKWIEAVGGWLEKSDQVIAARMQPLHDIDTLISSQKETHRLLSELPNKTDAQLKYSADQLMALKARKKVLENNLQDELRNNPELNLHVEDWNALSATEAETVIQLNRRVEIAEKEVNERKETIRKIREESQKRNAAVLKSKTQKTAKGNKYKSDVGNLVLEQEEAKLALVQRELEEETENLQQMMHEGKVNPRLFTKDKDSFIYRLKDPNDRLRFRDLYESKKNPVTARAHAEAYYNTIMNQTPEDTINQIMGRVTGNASESTLKARTLMLPDELLYNNNFMTKDLMAKIANYTTYLSRRTHLKNVFRDVSPEGGIESVLAEVNADHEKLRTPLFERKIKLEEKSQEASLTPAEKMKIKKDIKKIDKELVSKKKEFETVKSDLNHLFDKMMGTHRGSTKAGKIKDAVMAFTAASSLGFLPLTQLNDIGGIGLQAGVIPLLRDGLYPAIESLFGLRKTMDSRAFREGVGSLHLGVQDIQNAQMSRNYDSLTNPYLNKGRIVSGLESVSHIASNFNFTNYIDNGLQRLSTSVYQSDFMRIIDKYVKGEMSQNEMIKIGKYGIDLEVWGKRMHDAFTKEGGGKTKLGGYQSMFWEWSDIEASNKFGDTVFRAVRDTQIQAGIADSPFWTDEHSPFGILGTIIRGFSGWAFASLNRYVIPAIQNPADAEKMAGVIFMLATGAFVSPARRMARGEDPYPEGQTNAQLGFEILTDSGWFSWFGTVLQDANLLSQGRLLQDLKNDKYKDRAMSGLFGPAWGKVTTAASIIDAASSGEWNENDMKKAARMLPFANAWWTYWMSAKIIESIGLPKTRQQARALKGT